MYNCVFMYAVYMYIHNYIHRCALNCGQFKTTHNERESESVREESAQKIRQTKQTDIRIQTQLPPWLNESNDETISIREREKQNPPNAVSSLNISCRCLLLLLRSHGSRNFNDDDCSLYARIHIYIHTYTLRL